MATVVEVDAALDLLAQCILEALRTHRLGDAIPNPEAHPKEFAKALFDAGVADARKAFGLLLSMIGRGLNKAASSLLTPSYYVEIFQSGEETWDRVVEVSEDALNELEELVRGGINLKVSVMVNCGLSFRDVLIANSENWWTESITCLRRFVEDAGQGPMPMALIDDVERLCRRGAVLEKAEEFCDQDEGRNRRQTVLTKLTGQRLQSALDAVDAVYGRHFLHCCLCVVPDFRVIWAMVNGGGSGEDDSRDSSALEKELIARIARRLGNNVANDAPETATKTQENEDEARHSPETANGSTPRGVALLDEARDAEIQGRDIPRRADEATTETPHGPQEHAPFNTNELMLIQYARDPSCIEWSATQWCEWFKADGREVDNSTVKKTATWKVIMRDREREKQRRQGGESER